MLSPDQIEALKHLAAKGATLSDLQRYLKEEQQVSITYMDTRFLILDLGIELLEEKEAEPAAESLETPSAPVPTGKVTVTMDHITLPGAMVSGKVTFSDGESAIWMLDTNGRPGLDPDTAGYRPSQEDIMAFQTQLRAIIQQHSGQA